MKIEFDMDTVKYRSGRYVVYDIEYLLKHLEEETELLMLYMRQKKRRRPTLDKEITVRGKHETTRRNRFT